MLWYNNIIDSIVYWVYIINVRIFFNNIIKFFNVFLLISLKHSKQKYYYIKKRIGDWGLGIGDWGLGIGPNPQSPSPNPQSPSPIPIGAN